MKIDILCNDGSPLGVTVDSIYGRDGRMGVGGAELALLTMCEAWNKEGHDVTLYNNPNNPVGSPFPQLPIDAFSRHGERDVLIIFRSPNQRILGSKVNGLKVWWSTDQFTMGDFKQFSQQVDRIVTISKFHTDYFKTMYGITNAVNIDLPVRTWEYKDKVIKADKRCIFTSVPDRGVMPLHAAWPLIVREVPDASLVITSDWRLWSEWADESMIYQYKLAFARHPNVSYMSAVKRDELVRQQMMAQVHLYPCMYDELFCISVAESQVAGVYPITTSFGALGSTNMGMVLHGTPTDPKWVELFVEKAVEVLKDSALGEKQERLKELATNRFSPSRIIQEWDEKVFY